MSNQQDPFADIRPFNDDEVKDALQRLIKDDIFINAVIKYRFPSFPKQLTWMLRAAIRLWLKNKWSRYQNVHDLQMGIATIMDKMINETTTGVTYSGLERLEKGESYVFVSNHRDIAMDPAFVNYGLHRDGRDTARIAIGDNLLSMDCASDLMRLNKSFIVKRSAKAPREMMKALAHLSAYIKHSLDEGQSIWIAQREGRAKDGNDQTDPAILKMFYVNGKKQKLKFDEYIKELNIVPVTISYEFDPCDTKKAIELYIRKTQGDYIKGKQEDIMSIVRGIIGYKGHVHVAFGTPITDDITTPDALAEEIDSQIAQNYKLYANNYISAGVRHETITNQAIDAFNKRIDQIPKEMHPIFEQMYAYPVQKQE